jgi:hypothetical protein
VAAASAKPSILKPARPMLMKGVGGGVSNPLSSGVLPLFKATKKGTFHDLIFLLTKDIVDVLLIRQS